MTTAEQQAEIKQAFNEEKWLFKCPMHGWVKGNDRMIAKQDHENCFESRNEYSDEDLVSYNPTVHEAIKEIERREINN